VLGGVVGVEVVLWFVFVVGVALFVDCLLVEYYEVAGCYVGDIFVD